MANVRRCKQTERQREEIDYTIGRKCGIILACFSYGRE